MSCYPLQPRGWTWRILCFDCLPKRGSLSFPNQPTLRLITLKITSLFNISNIKWGKIGMGWGSVSILKNTSKCCVSISPMTWHYLDVCVILVLKIGIKSKANRLGNWLFKLIEASYAKSMFSLSLLFWEGKGSVCSINLYSPKAILFTILKCSLKWISNLPISTW